MNTSDSSGDTKLVRGARQLSTGVAKWFGSTLIISAIYVLTARLAFALDAVLGCTSLLWIPAGVSLVILLLFGTRFWPGILIGALLVKLATGTPLLIALCIGIGDTLEPLAGAYLLQRFVGFDTSMDRLQDVLGLIVLGAGCSTLISATIAVGSLWLNGMIQTSRIGHVWHTRWMADVLGDLIIAPFILVWMRKRLVLPSRKRLIEMVLMSATVIFVCIVVFRNWLEFQEVQRTFLVFPLLVWASVRFGLRGSMTVSLITISFAISGTAQGLGPFKSEVLNGHLLGFQTFMGAVALTVLVISVALAERRQAIASLQAMSGVLEMRVEERTAELAALNKRLSDAQMQARVGSWEWDIPYDKVFFSKELYRVVGAKPQEIDHTYQGFVNLFHPDDREIVRQNVEESCRTGNPADFDSRIVQPENSMRWMHWHSEVEMNISAQPIRMFGTGQDITERKRSDEKFRDLLESAPDAMVIVEPAGTVTLVNSQTEKLFGYSRVELVGKPFITLIPKRYRESQFLSHRGFSQSRATGSAQSGSQLYGLRRDGNEFPVDVSVSPLETEEGVLAIFAIRDVTDRMQAEQKFRDLLESAPDAMVIVEPNGTITLINSQTEKLFGYSRDELIGQPVEVLVPEQFRDKHFLHVIGYFREPHTRSMGTGLELYGLRKSGEEFSIEVSLSPLQTSEGTLVTSAIRDITERKRAQHQMQMLGQTMTSINECIVITNLDNTILSYNPAFLRTYGYEVHEVIGKDISTLRSPNNPTKLAIEISASTRNGGWHGEVIDRKKTGEEFPVFLSTSLARDQHGNPIALVEITRDITEQKLLHRQLLENERQRLEDLRRFTVSVQRAQEEERRRIARELHDDLGQRLSAMKFNIEAFVEGVPGNLRKIRGKFNNVRAQIDEMITELRRISANLRPAALDDFGLVVALQLLCKKMEQTQSITIAFHGKTSTVEHFDNHVEIALYRVAQEALANITKHAQATHVDVHLAHVPGALNLVVEDNGRGFDAEKIQGLKQTQRGMGLISMRERTELLGGSFRVESVPGKRTTITVQIPLDNLNA